MTQILILMTKLEERIEDERTNDEYLLPDDDSEVGTIEVAEENNV